MLWKALKTAHLTCNYTYTWAFNEQCKWVVMNTSGLKISLCIIQQWLVSHSESYVQPVARRLQRRRWNQTNTSPIKGLFTSEPVLHMKFANHSWALLILPSSISIKTYTIYLYLYKNWVHAETPDSKGTVLHLFFRNTFMPRFVWRMKTCHLGSCRGAFGQIFFNFHTEPSESSSLLLFPVFVWS